jgi:diguanylate cyclase (GGDEF)-like protein
MARARQLFGNRLARFVWPLTLAGFVVLALQIASGALDAFRDPSLSLVVVVAGTVVAERVELSLTRGEDESRFTAGAPFGFAVLLVAGPGAAVAAWTLAVVVTEIIRRASPLKIAFNTAQYVLSMTAAGLVFVLLAPHSSPNQLPLHLDDAPAVILSGLVLFTVNQTMTIEASARSLGVRARDTVREEGVAILVIDGLLLGLAPVIAVMAVHAPMLLPLVGLPTAALWMSAREADRRRHEAMHDALTKLPNRRLFRARVEHEIARGTRSGRQPIVMWLDLDGFKDVNDALGHACGDRVLEAVAGRLTGVAREQDLVARLGGDEFGILVGAPNDCSAVDALAGRIAEALQEPVPVADLQLQTGGSIGIARAQLGDTAEELLRRADVAMYQAKARESSIASYEPADDPHDPERLKLLADLRAGIPRGELVVHYQPQVRLDSGEITAVEALVRWQHPQRGLLAPADFIELAERGGLMGQLTRVVLHEALAQVAAWRTQGIELSVAVNVSPRAVIDDQMPVMVGSALEEFGLPGAALTLEITESVLMQDVTRAARLLAALAERGVRVSVDDFGTGYSSLALLQQLPVSEIKVDRSFVSAMSRDHNARVIVESTVSLGRALRLDVVAEGVETLYAFDVLAEIGCTIAQGYLIGKAVPADELDPVLRAPRRPSHSLEAA